MKDCHRFARFAIVGGLCFCTNLAALYVGIDMLGWGLFLATLLSFVSTNILGWLLNRIWTFKTSDTSAPNEFARYVTVNVASYFLSLGLMALFINVFGVNYLVTSAIVAILMLAGNYIAHNRLSFLKSESTGSEGILLVKNNKAVLATHYFPSHGGGVECVAWQIARRLIQQNVSITWFASAVDKPPAASDYLETIPVSCWNVAEKKMGFPYPLWSLSAVPKMWRAIREADIVHVHECLYMGCVLAAIMARMSGKRLILTQHVGFVPYKNPVLRLLLGFANRTVARFVMALSDEVVFISKSVELYFAGLWRWKKSPLFVSNGVDSDLYKPPSNAERVDSRSAFDLADDKVVFLFVGRFVEKKGLNTIRMLAERMPEYIFYLAGRGPIDPVSWGLPNVFVFADRSGHTLLPLYWAADYFVLPSVGEGFPLVIQEAMACGLPVITSKENAAACPGVESLVQDIEQGGIAWEVGIREAVKKSHLAKERAEDGVFFARKQWSWDHVADTYCTLYDTGRT